MAATVFRVFVALILTATNMNIAHGLRIVNSRSEAIPTRRMSLFQEIQQIVNAGNQEHAKKVARVATIQREAWNEPKVAMIMTGLLRPLRFKTTTDLLKYNLFDALADNGIGANFDGEQKEDVRKRMENELAPLNPKAIVWYEAGSDEAAEEEAAWFPGAKHLAARVAGPRLYSQFFNRWMNYQRVLEHEAKTGISYAWFVTSRVDLLWVAKQPPISFFNKSKVTVSALWNWDVPDIFFVSPRELSDKLYTMNHFVEDCCYHKSPDIKNDECRYEEQQMGSLKFSQELTTELNAQCCKDEYSWNRCDGGEHTFKVIFENNEITKETYPFDTTITHFTGNEHTQSMSNECWRMGPSFAHGETRHNANGGKGVSLVSVAACNVAHAYISSCLEKRNSLCEPPEGLEAGSYFMPYAIAFGNDGKCLTLDGENTTLSSCASHFFSPSHFGQGDADAAKHQMLNNIRLQAYFPVKSKSQGMFSGQKYHLQVMGDSEKCLSLRNDYSQLPNDVSAFEARTCNDLSERQQWTLTPSNDGGFKMEMPGLGIQMDEWNLKMMSSNKDNKGYVSSF